VTRALPRFGALALLVLSVGCCAHSDPPKIEATAITPGGSPVVLFSDGTWRAAEVRDAAPFALDAAGRIAKVSFARLPVARVLRYVDGDTFRVRFVTPPPACMDVEESLRLLGMDTPEVGDDEALAGEATKLVAALIGDGSIRLAFDYVLRGYYGRLLCYVFLPDRRCLNLLLVAEGMATVYPNEELHLHARLRQAEAEARNARMGIWGRDHGGVRVRDVRNDGAAEHVVLTNESRLPVNLAGWMLRDEAGTELALPGLTLRPGEWVRLYSGADGVADPPRSYILTERNVWNNGGDTATLVDDTGAVVDRYSYPE
jgi:endonuclease YncB( thermonuclease family)